MKSGAHKIYDYVVLGAGSGGIATARRAAILGKKVALIENSRLGGTCVNLGCVPKKMMWSVANYMDDHHLMQHGYGFPKKKLIFNFKEFKYQRDAEILRLNGIYEENLLKSGVDIINGSGTFLDNKTI